MPTPAQVQRIVLGSQRAGGGGAPAPVLSSINANGWSGEWANAGTLPAYSTAGREFTPDTAPVTVAMSRQGYDATGSATTHNENNIVMRRVRQPYTTAGAATHLLGSTATVALAGFVYSTDTLTGITNNSTEISPVPVAQWQQRNRRVTGNSLYVELVAFHRSAAGGKPVAAVTATATDGTTTTSPLLLTLGVLPSSTDQAPIIGYYGTIDVTALADGACSYNAKVYPRIGGSGSVLDSASGTLDARGFTPQSFYKAAGSSGVFKSKGSAPVYAYVVVSGGTDGTVDVNGALAGNTKISATAATAAANPFATMTSAFNALKAATNVTGGFTDGCIVRLGTGAHSMTAPGAGTYQSGGEVIIESDPGVSASGVSLSGWNAMRQSWLTIRNLTYTRVTTGQIAALTGGRIGVENCVLDLTSSTTAAFATSPYYINGATCTTAAGSSFAATSAASMNMGRGLVLSNASATAITVDGFNITGGKFVNAGFVSVSRDLSGAVIAYNFNGKCTGTVWTGQGSTSTTAGHAVVQNIFEFISATSNPTARPSSDDQTYQIVGLIEWNNTYAGASIYGRHNSGYDETIGTLRTNKQWSQVGNIYTTYYTKHDWFIGATKGDTDANLHVGSWSTLYHAGSRGNFFQFPTVAGQGPSGGPNGSECPADFGLGAKWSTSTYARLDPLYATGGTALGKATTVDGAGAPTAGSGGVAADYQLASGSPCKAMVPSGVLPFDFGGNARNAATDTAGAWA